MSVVIRWLRLSILWSQHIDMVQVHPGCEGMVVIEPAVERFGQCRNLGPEPSLGQHHRIALSGDERLEDGPAGSTQGLGCHRGELDARIFEQLFQALDFPGLSAT